MQLARPADQQRRRGPKCPSGPEHSVPWSARRLEYHVSAPPGLRLYCSATPNTPIQGPGL